MHFIGGALGRQRVQLDDAATIEEAQRRVKAYADTHPDRTWILGGGWYYSLFGATALPDRRLLDAVVPDRPVYPQAYDGHSSWANTKALELAGITGTTPDPANGVIVRDPRTRQATGALKETAGALIEKVIPAPTRAERLEALRQAIRYVNSLGITRVHSAGGDAEVLELLRHAAPAAGVDAADARRAVHQSAGGHARGAGPRRGAARHVSRRVDERRRREVHARRRDRGAHRGGARALRRRSGDHAASSTGIRRPLPPASPSSTGAASRSSRTRSAIGPSASRSTPTRPTAPAAARPGRRFRIEHIESPSAADIPRFGALGVIASMQPLHATPGPNLLDVGPRRSARSARRGAGRGSACGPRGGVLAFGSDWPVVTIDPWQGLRMLRTRQTLDGTPAGGWLPAERISIEQAIEGYTLGAAVAGRLEATEGSIDVREGRRPDRLVARRPARFPRIEWPRPPCSSRWPAAGSSTTRASSAASRHRWEPTKA